MCQVVEGGRDLRNKRHVGWVSSESVAQLINGVQDRKRALWPISLHLRSICYNLDVYSNQPKWVLGMDSDYRSNCIYWEISKHAFKNIIGTNYKCWSGSFGVTHSPNWVGRGASYQKNQRIIYDITYEISWEVFRLHDDDITVSGFPWKCRIYNYASFLILEITSLSLSLSLSHSLSRIVIFSNFHSN